jgi:hypothetical protein
VIHRRGRRREARITNAWRNLGESSRNSESSVD